MIAAAVAGAYFVVPVYKGLVGLACLLLIVAAVYVYNRYMALTYHYDVMIDSSGVPLFVVRSTVGKRSTTLCRVELSSVTSVTRLTDREISEHKAPDGYARYNYTPTMLPDTVVVLTVASRYEHSEITIEAHDEFLRLLVDYSNEARALFPDDE